MCLRELVREWVSERERVTSIASSRVELNQVKHLTLVCKSSANNSIIKKLPLDALVIQSDAAVNPVAMSLLLLSTI